MQILPYDEADVSQMLEDLADHGFIERYTSDNTRCVYVPTFAKHQRPHPTEARSDLPRPRSAVKRRKARQRMAKDGSESKASESLLRNNSAERIYLAYPVKVGRDEAIPAILKALTELQKKPAPPDWKPEQGNWPPEDVEAWLIERVRLFGLSPAGNAGTYTPYAAKWFKAGRYLDHPAEWARREQHEDRHVAPVSKFIGPRRDLKELDKSSEETGGTPEANRVDEQR